jgi:hypothetical protein
VVEKSGKGNERGGGAGRYVLVTGQSGGGKSSLIANWWSRTHVSKKGILADTNTFIHFIGKTLHSLSPFLGTNFYVKARQ